MPSFWPSKPKPPPANAPQPNNPNNNNTNNTINNKNEDQRVFSAVTLETRSSEEGDGPRSGQTTPKPSGLDNRIPAIASVTAAALSN